MRKLFSQWFKRTASADQPSVAEVPGVPLTKRQRRLNASLETLHLFTPGLREALQVCNLQTVADLLGFDLAQAAIDAKLTARHAKQLRRIQRAIRLSFQIRRLHPRDAIVLMAIHRSNVDVIAADSPKHLFRDIQRFALSSRGTKLIARMGMPTQEQVTQWIEAARERQSKRSLVHPSEAAFVNRRSLCPKF